MADRHLVVGSLEVLGDLNSGNTRQIRRSIEAIKNQTMQLYRQQNNWWEKLSSDGVITPTEKQQLLREFENIRRSFAAIYLQAENLGFIATLVVMDYIRTYEALRTYIYTELKLFDNMQADTPLPDREYFNTMFSNYYYSESFTLIAINQEIAATINFRVLENLNETGEENEVALYMGGIYMWVNGAWKAVSTGDYKGALTECPEVAENVFFLAADDFYSYEVLYVNGEELEVNNDVLALKMSYEKGYIYYVEDGIWHKDNDTRGYRYVAAFADVINVTGQLPALFQDALDSLQSQVDDIVSDLSTQSASLAEEIRTREGEYTIIGRDIVRIDDRIYGIVQRVEGSENAITGLENATGTIQSNLTSVTGRVRDVEGDLDGVGLALEGLTENTEDIHAELTDIDDTLDDINVSIGGVNLSLTDISDDTHEIETNINGMNVKISGLNDDVPGIKVDITNIKTGVQNINSAITGLENATATLQNGLTSVTGRVRDVEGDLDGVGLALEGLTEDTEDIHAELTDIDDTLDDINVSVGGVNLSLTDIDDTVGTIETNINGMNVKISGLNDDVPGIKVDITNIKTGVQNINSAITGLENATATLQGNVTSISGRVTDVENDLNGVGLAISGLTSDTADIHTELTDIDDTLDDINVSIGGVNLSLTDISDDTHEIETNINGMNVKISGLNNDVPGIKVDITDIKSGVQNINSAITDLQNNKISHLPVYFGPKNQDPQNPKEGDFYLYTGSTTSTRTKNYIYLYHNNAWGGLSPTNTDYRSYYMSALTDVLANSEVDDGYFATVFAESIFTAAATMDNLAVKIIYIRQYGAIMSDKTQYEYQSVGLCIKPNGDLDANGDTHIAGKVAIGVDLKNSNNQYMPDFANYDVVIGGNVKISGELAGATGSFAGALSGASGDFSGELNCGSLKVVMASPQTILFSYAANTLVSTLYNKLKQYCPQDDVWYTKSEMFPNLSNPVITYGTTNITQVKIKRISMGFQEDPYVYYIYFNGWNTPEMSGGVSAESDYALSVKYSLTERLVLRMENLPNSKPLESNTIYTLNDGILRIS